MAPGPPRHRPFLGRPNPNPAPVAQHGSERAEFALKNPVHPASPDETILKAEIRRLFNNLPALIRMNGLGQALAFFRMKGEGTAHASIYHMVGAWPAMRAARGRIFSETPTCSRRSRKAIWRTTWRRKTKAWRCCSG